MEANRPMNITKEKFSYLVKIHVGPHSESMLIVNDCEVPKPVMELMAKEKITKRINKLFEKARDYRLQTIDSYFSKMIKQSDFEIEDLNSIEIFDMKLKFEKESIQNHTGESQIFQSKLNEETQEENHY